MSNIKTIKKLIQQIFVPKKLFHCLYVAIIPALLFYIISIIILNAAGFELMQILQDPAQQTKTSSFLGFLSNIGIWLWVSSAAICFFFVFTPKTLGKKGAKNLLFLIGLFSLVLGVDDFFMIHDLYIHQKIVYLIYAILIGTLFIRYYKIIIEVEGFAFFLAGAFLGLSVITDLIQRFIPWNYEYIQVVEEAFKFIGAATWLYFTGRIALYLLVSENKKIGVSY